MQLLKMPPMAMRESGHLLVILWKASSSECRVTLVHVVLAT